MTMHNVPTEAPLGAWTNEFFISDVQARVRELFTPPGGSGDDGDVPRRKRFRAHYWVVWSPRLNRRIGIYRDIGHDHWVLIETDSAVGWFSTLGNARSIAMGSRKRLRPFDMVLTRGNVFECHRLTGDDGMHDDEEAAAEHAWCKARGLLYRRISAADIERERIYIQNWKRMLPYIRKPSHPLDARVLGYVSAVGELTLGEIDVLLADVEQTEVRACVFGLLHRGHLIAPNLRHQPLTSATPVRLRHGH